jgi:hypothetical protein
MVAFKTNTTVKLKQSKNSLELKTHMLCNVVFSTTTTTTSSNSQSVNES